MKATTKLTTVNVLDDVYKKFKVDVIDGNINLQKISQPFYGFIP